MTIAASMTYPSRAQMRSRCEGSRQHPHPQPASQLRLPGAESKVRKSAPGSGAAHQQIPGDHRGSCYFPHLDIAYRLSLCFHARQALLHLLHSHMSLVVLEILAGGFGSGFRPLISITEAQPCICRHPTCAVPRGQPPPTESQRPHLHRSNVKVKFAQPSVADVYYCQQWTTTSWCIPVLHFHPHSRSANVGFHCSTPLAQWVYTAPIPKVLHRHCPPATQPDLGIYHQFPRAVSLRPSQPVQIPSQLVILMTLELETVVRLSSDVQGCI